MVSFSGICLLLVAVAIPLAWPTIAGDPKIKRTVIWLLVLRQFVTFLHILAGPLPTVNKDPMAFNAFALELGFFHLKGNEYAIFLRSLYETVGGSHLLGCEVSHIGFAFALIAQTEILILLGLRHATPRLLCLFALMPSVLLNTSVVLREGLQMGGFLMLAYCVLEVRRRGLGPSVLLLLPACVLLIWIHRGFAPYIVTVLPVALLWAFRARPIALATAVSLGVISLLLIGPGRIVEELQSRSQVIDAVVEGSGLEYIDSYQDGVGRGREIRSAFSTTLDLSSASRAAATVPIVFLEYMLSPLPWQIRGVYDLYGFIESTVRLVLIFGAVQAIRRASGEQRRLLLCLAIMFIAMEGIWSAGTANWGTAFRHRVVAWGLLVAVGGHFFYQAEETQDSSALKKAKITRSAVRAMRRRRQGVQERSVESQNDRSKE